MLVCDKHPLEFLRSVRIAGGPVMYCGRCVSEPTKSERAKSLIQPMASIETRRIAGRRTISTEQVHAIRQALRRGERACDLATRFHVSRTHIYKIKHRQTRNFL